MLDNDKVFYNPGQMVRIRHKGLDYVPIMWVIEKATRTILDKTTGEANADFLGIRCRWFNKNSDLCEAIFSSKDLEHV